MSKNFRGRVMRCVYGVWCAPANLIACVFSIAVIALFAGSAMTTATAILLLLAGLGAALLWQNRIKSGTNQVSGYFAVYRTPGCRWDVISQYENRGAAPTCAAAMRGLAREQYTLVDAIPQGRYRVITHGVVLRRIEAADTLTIISCRPIGVDTLESVQRRMRGGRGCAQCTDKENCRFAPMIMASRQFYYVKFEKEK